MLTHSFKDRGHHKVADLTVSEYISLQNQVLVGAIEEALRKVIPQKDPNEDIYWTTQQAADRLGLSRQTIQNKKAAGLIEYEGEGRTTRFTKAACLRFLKHYGVANHSIGRQIENPTRKRFTRKKKGQ